MFGLSVDPRTQIELLVVGAGPSERFPSEGPTAWARAGQSRSPPNGPGPARSRALEATAAVLWQVTRTRRKVGSRPSTSPWITPRPSGFPTGALQSSGTPPRTHGSLA